MYAPPSHAPPDVQGSSSGSAGAGAGSGSHDRPYSNPYGPYAYAPTTQPTPGQPLLNNGKMLVYPHDWQGCPKCHNTGYKYGDPSNPCQKCWNRYAQKPNAILIASAGMRGAKILQRPLSTAGASMPMSPMQTGNAMGAFNGYPGSAFYGAGSRPWDGAMAQQHTGMSSFAPPSHPPSQQHAHPRPAGPPAVQRDSEAENVNEDGEAPPAYEDAVAAGPHGALPPQRRRQGDGQASSQPGIDGRQSPSSMMANMHVTGQPLAGPSAYIPPPQPMQPMQPHPPVWHPQQYPPQPHPALPFHILHHTAVPPPNAIAVAPGDPRIGGQLCYKCGGRGIRETIWLTDETCNRCGGIGRLLM